MNDYLYDFLLLKVKRRYGKQTYCYRVDIDVFYVWFLVDDF